MINKENSHSYYSRKILQIDSSSSSFDTSQPSFIALLCIISILTVAFVITVIILCYRYYSQRERKSKIRNKYPRILSIENNQQSTIPTSITPTSLSSYSVRSSDHLVSNQHNQTPSINTLPSRRFQQSILDAYLNDINTFQPTSMDVKQLNPYLFIDLHSTSSETFPNKTITTGYSTSTDNEYQQRRRSTLLSKRLHNSRFLMRERSLPTNLPKLPQLHQVLTQQQKHLFGLDDMNNSSTTVINPDLQSTSLSTTTNDYDDSHAYHVHQSQINRTIKEEKPFIIHSYSSLHQKQEPQFFEVVSTSRDDYSDTQISNKSVPIITDRIAYMNDSIIV